MNKEYAEGISDLIYLCGCAVREETPDRQRVSQMDLEALYRAAERHMLCSAAAMALERAGIRDAAFTQAKGKAIHKLVTLETEKAQLTSRLEERGIWYTPLKGAVLKDLYPAFGMRQMSDYDILFDASCAETVRELMQEQGFRTEEFDYSFHDVYIKAPVCVFEMHRRLFGASHTQLNDYYRDIKSRLLKDEGANFGYHFSPEDFYVYMTAHEYVHYSGSGTGLRSFLDVYVYLRHFGAALDLDYVRREAEKLGLAAFEERSRRLAFCLFEGRDAQGEDAEMLDYILRSGVYGTVENITEKRLEQMDAGSSRRLRYVLRRLFLPMSGVQERYPFFYRHKLLLPLLFFYRVFLALTRRRARIRKELSAILHYKSEKEQAEN